MDTVMLSHRARPPALTRRAAVRRIVTTGAACCVATFVATTGLPVGITPSIDPVQAQAAPMTLIHQDLALAADATLSISFQLSTPITATDAITVVAHRRITDRTELADAIAGDSGGIIGSLQIDPNAIPATDPAVTDPAAVDPADPAAVDPAAVESATVVTVADGTVTITVPTSRATGNRGALWIPSPGLYPITIDVQQRDGTLVGELLTFVDRLPVAPAPDADGTTSPSDGTGAAEHLNVSIVASITAPPLIPGANTPLPDLVNQQIAELSQYSDNVPLSVSISPDVLARLDPKTLTELQPVLARSSLLSQPNIPLDPSAAAAAGQSALFIDLLQAGEDLTTQLVGARPTRPVWVEQQPLTSEGAALLRSLGVNLVVLTPETYADVGVDNGFFGAFTLYSLLRNVQLPDGAVVPASVTDPQITRYLTNAAMSPELAALYTAAELVTWSDWLAADFPSLARNSVVLQMPGGGVLGPDRVSRMVEMANGTGAVSFGTVDSILGNTDSQLNNGKPSTITLAAQQPVDLLARAEAISAARARQATTSAMLLPEFDGGRTPTWQATLLTLESSSITDAQVETTIGELNAQFDAIAANVTGPPSYTFTMNGQSISLHAKIENHGDEPLNAMVHLSSSQDKIEFPDNDQVVVLLPGSNDIRIPVRARSNGTSTIYLQVLAPDSTRIAAVSVIKAQVNALTGLAQVITGGMALVLLTWWVRNLRRSRRTRATVISLDNHPARPTNATPTVAVAAATLAADSVIDSATVEPSAPSAPSAPSTSAASAASAASASTATAVTSNATITAATDISQLDTSHSSETAAPDGTVEPAAVEPAEVEPAAVEPAEVEPAAVEPAEVEPAAVDPGSTTLSDS